MVNGLASKDKDLNNASVVIIDQLSTNELESSDNGDFEEVISRKAKRQRQIQHQQEEERAQRERQKMEQRQKQREEKHRKPIKKISASRQSNEELKQLNEDEIKSVQHVNDSTSKVLSSISPISATDSGVAAISSASPTQLTLDGDQSTLQNHVSVSIPAQHPTVWNR
jgi:hypothetical protein